MPSHIKQPKTYLAGTCITFIVVAALNEFFDNIIATELAKSSVRAARQNLLDNAIRHAPADTVVLVQIAEADGNSVEGKGQRSEGLMEFEPVGITIQR